MFKKKEVNLTQLEKLSKEFAKKIKISEIVLFKGDLGSGKTTFIRYLINFLQKKNKQSITEISSPTFNLVHEYQLGSLIIKHYDLYRINDEKELTNIGIYEGSSDEITLIEWPEKMKKHNTNNIIDLSFEYDDEFKKRFLNISSSNNVGFLDEFKKS